MNAGMAIGNTAKTTTAPQRITEHLATIRAVSQKLRSHSAELSERISPPEHASPHVPAGTLDAPQSCNIWDMLREIGDALNAAGHNLTRIDDAI